MTKAQFVGYVLSFLSGYFVCFFTYKGVSNEITLLRQDLASARLSNLFKGSSNPPAPIAKS